MPQSFWHEELELAVRVNITLNVVNEPEAQQIEAAIHQKNLQLCTSRRSSSGEDSLMLLPIRHSGIGFSFIVYAGKTD